MNTERRYNGWTNWETWNANLWLTNDESTQGYCEEQAQKCYEVAAADKTFTKVENAAYALKDRLKDLFEQEADSGLKAQSSWMADAINAYISEVNWREIAETFIEECRGGEVYEA